MDYSLLVGIDGTANELVIGIIGGYFCVFVRESVYVLRESESEVVLVDSSSRNSNEKRVCVCVGYIL